jgi:triosephosphate isomerase
VSARRPLVAGNWKMHKTRAEARAFVEAFFEAQPRLDDVDAVVFPPFTALATVGDAIAGRSLGLGAQTMAADAQGAFTGEISVAMIAECGAAWVILGHSERRAMCGETDGGVRRKVDSALRAGLVPIVAVGETADEHRAGLAHERVASQVKAAFADLAPADVARCVVAYEPIWAIGSGSAEDPQSANTVMGVIRAAVAGLEEAHILYGGSVKPDNIAAFIAQPHIDGALVGSASLDPRSFAQLIANARPAVAS